jgi:SAM-dependent methyltransferase
MGRVFSSISRMKLETERDATEWLWAAKALAVVSAWNKLGWFDKLKSGPSTLEALGGDPRAMRVTLPVLMHLGLLASDGDRISLTPQAKRLVEQRDLPSERNLDALGDLARTVDVLRDGGPVKGPDGQSKATQGGTLADDPVHTERFLDMLYRTSEGAAADALHWLSPGMPTGSKVLDVGGGHGRYARTFADAGYPATLFDLPHVIELAKRRHGDALAYIAGDFHSAEDFGGPYDLCYLSNVVHGESPAANASLVQRLAQSLRSGGRIAIKDMFLDEHGQDPKNAVFFGLTMLFYTEQGSSPTLHDARSWFEQAGLVDLTVTVLDTHQLVCARKP